VLGSETKQELAGLARLCYTVCVQKTTITIRPSRPRTELLEASGGNLNKWINGLIERALGERKPDWEAHFRQPRRKVGYCADELRRASR